MWKGGNLILTCKGNKKGDNIPKALCPPPLNFQRTDNSFNFMQKMGTKSNQIKLKFFFSCEWFTIYKRDPMHESRGPRAKALFIYMIMQSTPEYLGKYLPRWIFRRVPSPPLQMQKFWCPWHGAWYNGWHCQHLLASLIILLRLFGGGGSYCFQIRVQASIFELIETAFFSLTFNFSYSPFDFSLWFCIYSSLTFWLFLWLFDYYC